MAKVKTTLWYDQRPNAAIVALVSLLAAYLMGSRALNTGSLQQYALTLIILGFAINRLIKAIRG